LILVTPTGDGIHSLVTIAPLRFTFSSMAPYLALLFIGDAILFWLIVAHIVRPLRRVTGAVQVFGRGDFSVRAPIAREDEIGQLAAAFNDMAGRIETLVTSERRLLQDVSHELRSPLTRLNVAIELSRTAMDRGHAADQLQREASRLSDLVETLLEVVRLEGDPGSASLTPVALMPVLHDSVRSGAFEAERHQIRLVLDGRLDHTILGNAELLRRAFDNIIGNAVRYSPAEGVVTVTCRQSEDDVVIEVHDCGPGVDESHLAKLGSPFYRTDESRTSVTGGVGLGLAIARRAVHLHGGTLEFSNARPGLRVTIHLPAGRRDALFTPTRTEQPAA
jgi:two-component system sensor histidine kinase CpxA